MAEQGSVAGFTAWSGTEAGLCCGLAVRCRVSYTPLRAAVPWSVTWGWVELSVMISVWNKRINIHQMVAAIIASKVSLIRDD